MTERYLTTGSEHTIYIKTSGNAKNKNSQINFGKKNNLKDIYYLISNFKNFIC